MKNLFLITAAILFTCTTFAQTPTPKRIDQLPPRVTEGSKGGPAPTNIADTDLLFDGNPTGGKLFNATMSQLKDYLGLPVPTPLQINLMGSERIAVDGSYPDVSIVSKDPGLPLFNSPSDGGFVYIYANAYNVIDPPSDINSLALDFSGNNNYDIVEIKFTHAVASITYLNATLAIPITSATAGEYIKLQFYAATNTWY